jgi:hypothetical protein
MTISHNKGLVSVAVCALAVLTISAASASPDRSGADTRQSPRARVNQCSMAVSKRKGGWACGMPGSAAGTLSATAEHCKPHQSWCWHLDPEAGRSTWMGQFRYGYGKKTLGTLSVYFLVALSGRESRSKPVRFVASGAVRHVIVEGDRLFYDANWPAGHPINPRVDESHLHHPANVPVRAVVQWPGGYDAFEKSPVHYGAVIHTWTWNVSGYAGTWYVFAKSIHYYFRGKSAFFFKRWQKHLGQQPVGYGWND